MSSGPDPITLPGTSIVLPGSRWQPTQDGLHSMLNVFREPPPNSGNEYQKNVYMQLQQLGAHPEFVQYLAYILAQMKQEGAATRSRAGLQLKNVLKANERWQAMTDSAREYVELQLLLCMGDSEHVIRNIVGTVVANIASVDGMRTWPTLLPMLSALLDSNNENYMDSALNTLQKIAEDLGGNIDNGQLGKPLHVLVPKLIGLCMHPSVLIRQYALTILNVFISFMPHALILHMNDYLQALFKLANDEQSSIRQCVCQAFVALLEAKAEVLEPHMDNVFLYLISCSSSPDDAVALEACEFWAAFADNHSTNLDLLRKYLPQLLPVLLSRMRYSEDQLIIFGEEAADDDQSVPDRQEDIKPRFHKGKVHGQQADPEDHENDEDDDDEISQWNLRKCAASALDTISCVLHEEILSLLLPHLQAALNTKAPSPADDGNNWVIRESGVLALGAIAEGCFDGLQPFLPQLIPYLYEFLKEEQPLLRSITCWTLSRFSRWVIDQQDDSTWFRPLLLQILNRVLDRNKRVQEAACSSFSTIEEEAQERLVPYLRVILQGLMLAFSKYQAKNLLLLYDAISTLAEAVGPKLDDADCVQILMPPLISKWNSLADDDPNIFPLLECLTSIAIALGRGFGGFAQPVFVRCLRIIERTLVAQRHAAVAGSAGHEIEVPGYEFIVCSLDLISGVVEGLGADIQPLLNSNPAFLPALLECTNSPDADTRQSAFALLGDIARNAMDTLNPHIDKFIPSAAACMDPTYNSVCNNAAWSVGEISTRISSETLQPFMTLLLDRLIAIIKAHQLPSMLLENVAITIGRLGLTCPSAVSACVSVFAQEWCNWLARIRDPQERIHSFKGLAAVIQAQPNSFLLPAKPGSIPSLCIAIASWHTPSSEMGTLFYQLLTAYKSLLGPQWNDYFGAAPEDVRRRLQTLYRL